jgi:hypothetical protein
MEHITFIGITDLRDWESCVLPLHYVAQLFYAKLLNRYVNGLSSAHSVFCQTFHRFSTEFQPFALFATGKFPMFYFPMCTNLWRENTVLESAWLQALLPNSSHHSLRRQMVYHLLLLCTHN